MKLAMYAAQLERKQHATQHAFANLVVTREKLPSEIQRILTVASFLANIDTMQKIPKWRTLHKEEVEAVRYIGGMFERLLGLALGQDALLENEDVEIPTPNG